MGGEEERPGFAIAFAGVFLTGPSRRHERVTSAFKITLARCRLRFFEFWRVVFQDFCHLLSDFAGRVRTFSGEDLRHHRFQIVKARVLVQPIPAIIGAHLLSRMIEFVMRLTILRFDVVRVGFLSRFGEQAFHACHCPDKGCDKHNCRKTRRLRRLRVIGWGKVAKISL
jgi:hypothetical protein